jgi:hypothetical protein
MQFEATDASGVWSGLGISTNGLFTPSTSVLSEEVEINIKNWWGNLIKITRIIKKYKI